MAYTVGSELKGENMLTLYKYSEDFGRMGELEGVFIADTKELEAKKDQTAYFGEVLGKHSDVVSDEWFDNLTEITDNPEVIEIVQHYDLENGYNPLEYIN